jgi:AcrR family transcriptional regulator
VQDEKSADGHVAPQLPLHGGRHSLPPDVVAYNQRERLLSALAAVVTEHGYPDTTVARITERAAVSRRTFYEHFDNREACFIAAYEAVDEHIQGISREACEASPGWPEGVATTLTELLRFLSGHPQAGRVWLVDSITVGEPMVAHRDASADHFTGLLSRGRQMPGVEAEHKLGEGLEEAILGGIVSLLGRRIVAGEAAELERFAPGIIEFALAPYLGFAAARDLATA